MIDWLHDATDAIGERLPTLGILAFSLCSTWSLFNLFQGNAAHPTLLYWLPAALVEIVTAWVVGQVVQQVRMLTKSNISKQDRRFYAIVVGAFAGVAAPLVSLSVWANKVEFDNLLLGSVFPVASIGCAIGAALPEAVQKFERQRAEDRAEKRRERRERREQRKREAELRQKVAELGRTGDVLALYLDDPTLTNAEAGEKLGITRQTVAYHLEKLEEEGLVKSNGNGIEVLAA
jgi:DNA-binding transcriptional ArsR family regulator